MLALPFLPSLALPALQWKTWGSSQGLGEQETELGAGGDRRLFSVSFPSAIIENMAEFRPEMCTEAAQQGLTQWLLKRLKVSVIPGGRYLNKRWQAAALHTGVLQMWLA